MRKTFVQSNSGEREINRVILQDGSSLQYSIYEMDQLIEEKNSELTALKTVSNQRIAKRELISVR